MEWQGRVFVDGNLPFGLRSAPLLFTALCDVIQWVSLELGATWVGHYIDDFVTIGPAGTEVCGSNLRHLKGTCGRLGMPLDEAKEEGPTAVLTFLGIEVDSNRQIIRLPEDKLEAMQSSFKHWRGMKSCRKRDLLSIIGSLSHACKAVRAGRSFLRRLIDLSTTVKRLDRRVQLLGQTVAVWHEMEWGGHAGDSRHRAPMCGDGNGCLGQVRLWGSIWKPLVPAEMAGYEQHPGLGHGHHSQIIAADSPHGGTMGPEVGRIGHYSTLRQSGGGGHCQLGHQQGVRGDVPAKMSGLSGGDMVVCCTG